MNEAAKIIQHFLATLDPDETAAAYAFLLGFYIAECDTVKASEAVRWARRSLDQTAAGQAIADQYTELGVG